MVRQKTRFLVVLVLILFFIVTTSGFILWQRRAPLTENLSVENPYKNNTANSGFKLTPLPSKKPTSPSSTISAPPKNTSPGSSSPLESSLTKKIQLLIFNPVLRNHGNQTLVKYLGWRDPDQLTSQIIKDLKDSSGGFVDYQIAERIEAEEFGGPKTDGFVYTEDSYLDCISKPASCHKPDETNYIQILTKYRSCEKRNQGYIDEVWIWSGPYFGSHWELTLVGPGAFWFNSPPVEGASCTKLLPIMGFNYERGMGEALESYGHRVESTMRQVYGGWDSKNGNSPWDIFTRREIDAAGQARCGNIHFAPASQSDYDWGNDHVVKSACDDYLNYPNLPNPPIFKDISCSIWECDGYKFKKWWFAHLPRNNVHTGGKWNNWWRYIVDFENAIKTL